jgi:hypothetical protein
MVHGTLAFAAMLSLSLLSAMVHGVLVVVEHLAMVQVLWSSCS